MKLRNRTGSITFEEFIDRVREDQKADLLDGVIYMASPESTDANDLFVWLIRLFADFVEVHDLGKVYGSRVAFRLEGTSGPEPDIAFVSKDNLSQVRRGYVLGPPDLAVEIVSPDSVERDYETKKARYEAAGVREYWIVDEEMQKVALLRLGDTGKYREVRPRRGELHSEVLPGFWLRPDWLWQDPRPKKTDILQQILTRPG